MLIEIHPKNPDERKIKQVVDCLKNGGLIIYPTDTVYGLGCDIYNTKAIEKLARLKGIKPEKANFSFICNDLSHISEYTIGLETTVFKLMKRTLPGPFTYILKANNSIPKLFKNNKKTVGVRIPDNQIARTIVKELGNPIVSTSIHNGDAIIDYLNDPYEIHEQFEKLVDIVIDGGMGDIEPSTIVDCTGDEPIIIRQGKGVLL
ncbi:MAG: threonylcarbamoyl-AMP synthase [Bacteroidetes bacterium]|jgi:tRNA threonylcarbamoyl adenosine modification protein (Sua5/YciO/YrdC/YwlC family)|nr:threonylcarbamoyl-AMP synthase [Bacteroidota bacterium]MBP7257107.1 threonylcarbamoyl-AMP synthase [Chitinophagales bacterium]MBK8674764.1 threonylcarbamoyl-AMP synthase [Bacteroidota bacterium]MBK9354596.1 threonylcarbamoyl-AMP synthase [Bacteroidota bacterium]MBK9635519.1 threonylcarbamoyl-AMP synthase [Bacteroidota bacterium]